MKSSGYVCCSHQQVNARQFLSVSSPIPYTPSVARIVGRSWVKRASPKRGDHQIERIVFNLKEPSSSGTSGTLSHLPATGSDVDKRLARITFGDKRGDILTGNLTDSTGGSIILKVNYSSSNSNSGIIDEMTIGNERESSNSLAVLAPVFN
ncbi:hypothetical protein RUM44_001373 [Polyplax serrata]|uniref:Uncharacterized protein n=1 Tax=Polyplax serrata TaxID=468196 RepID=A0ABR1AJU9_POLSC